MSLLSLADALKTETRVSLQWSRVGTVELLFGEATYLQEEISSLGHTCFREVNDR